MGVTINLLLKEKPNEVETLILKNGTTRRELEAFLFKRDKNIIPNTILYLLEDNQVNILPDSPIKDSLFLVPLSSIAQYSDYEKKYRQQFRLLNNVKLRLSEEEIDQMYEDNLDFDEDIIDNSIPEKIDINPSDYQTTFGLQTIKGRVNCCVGKSGNKKSKMLDINQIYKNLNTDDNIFFIKTSNESYKINNKFKLTLSERKDLIESVCVGIQIRSKKALIELYRNGHMSYSVYLESNETDYYPHVLTILSTISDLNIEQNESLYKGSIPYYNVSKWCRSISALLIKSDPSDFKIEYCIRFKIEKRKLSSVLGSNFEFDSRSDKIAFANSEISRIQLKEETKGLSETDKKNILSQERVIQKYENLQKNMDASIILLQYTKGVALKLIPETFSGNIVFTKVTIIAKSSKLFDEIYTETAILAQRYYEKYLSGSYLPKITTEFTKAVTGFLPSDSLSIEDLKVIFNDIRFSGKLKDFNKNLSKEQVELLKKFHDLKKTVSNRYKEMYSEIYFEKINLRRIKGDNEHYTIPEVLHEESFNEFLKSDSFKEYVNSVREYIPDVNEKDLYKELNHNGKRYYAVCKNVFKMNVAKDQTKLVYPGFLESTKEEGHTFFSCFAKPQNDSLSLKKNVLLSTKILTLGQEGELGSLKKFFGNDYVRYGTTGKFYDAVLLASKQSDPVFTMNKEDGLFYVFRNLEKGKVAKRYTRESFMKEYKRLDHTMLSDLLSRLLKITIYVFSFNENKIICNNSEIFEKCIYILKRDSLEPHYEIIGKKSKETIFPVTEKIKKLYNYACVNEIPEQTHKKIQLDSIKNFKFQLTDSKNKVIAVILNTGLYVPVYPTYPKVGITQHIDTYTPKSANDMYKKVDSKYYTVESQIVKNGKVVAFKTNTGQFVPVTGEPVKDVPILHETVYYPTIDFTPVSIATKTNEKTNRLKVSNYFKENPAQKEYLKTLIESKRSQRTKVASIVSEILGEPDNDIVTELYVPKNKILSGKVTEYIPKQRVQPDQNEFRSTAAALKNNNVTFEEFIAEQFPTSDYSLPNFDVKVVPGDGNCLFRALIQADNYQVTGHWLSRAEETKQAHLLRLRIAELLRKNRNKRLGFTTPEEFIQTEENKTFEVYVAEMAKDRTWGGVLEILCASNLLQKEIIVCNPRNQCHPLSDISRPDKIYILYVNNNHYDALGLRLN